MHYYTFKGFFTNVEHIRVTYTDIRLGLEALCHMSFLATAENNYI